LKIIFYQHVVLLYLNSHTNCIYRYCNFCFSQYSYLII